MLRSGTMGDATLISAPRSTGNVSGERDPEMHQSEKGRQCFFGMRAHIGVASDSGLVHTVRGTSGDVHGVVEANSLLHRQETDDFVDAGYQGARKRPDAKVKVTWNVAIGPGVRKLLDKVVTSDLCRPSLAGIVYGLQGNNLCNSILAVQ